MPRVREVPEIKILKSQIEDGAGVGNDVAIPVPLQDDREPALGVTTQLAHFRNVHSASGEPVQSNLAQWVITDARDETNSTPERRKVMRNYGRRTAQGEHHAIG